MSKAQLDIESALLLSSKEAQDVDTQPKRRWYQLSPLGKRQTKALVWVFAIYAVYTATARTVVSFSKPEAPRERSWALNAFSRRPSHLSPEQAEELYLCVLS